MKNLPIFPEVGFLKNFVPRSFGVKSICKTCHTGITYFNLHPVNENTTYYLRARISRKKTTVTPKRKRSNQIISVATFTTMDLTFYSIYTYQSART